MISDIFKCIFLHPNKCGGKSVEHAIFGVKAGSKADHRIKEDYIKEYGQEKWDSYYKFGFSRNPWDRCVSIYHGRKQIRRLPLPSFDEWIKQKDIKVNQQTLWFRDMDFVGRFERYEEDFAKVTERLCIDVELPHINKSKHKHYTEYYNDETIQIVRDKFKDDIDIFEYQFGE